MSQTWQNHYAALQGMLAKQQRPRSVPQVPAAIPTRDIAAEVTGDGAWWGKPDEGGTDTMGLPGPTGDWTGVHAAAPNAMAMSQAMGMDPLAGRAGMAALGLASPGVGMGLGALNTVGNAVNTQANMGMLAGLGASPSGWSQVGGLLGNNALAGNYTGALNYAMANQVPGFAGMSVAQQPGDYSTGGWGGWGDIAAEMGPTATAADLAQDAANNAPGAVEQEQLGSFAGGGYTGAGADGVVQPWKKAGMVHEGELVIPSWLLRRMTGK